MNNIVVGVGHGTHGYLKSFLLYNYIISYFSYNLLIGIHIVY